jgi:regulator of PEP synthase PpsR (kinase-PPPase family)
MTQAPPGSSSKRPLVIVSGGYGASGEQLARTALAQFEGADLPISIVPHVRSKEQIRDVVEKAKADHGTILHTLVDADLRRTLIETARVRNVVAIDLIGRVLSQLAGILGQEPLGMPGLYRQLREDYFNRVEAIEFAVAHDDGKRPEDLHKAEIVLTGPSRVGKTPLSMYLSVLGWKVANVPLTNELSPPEELFEVDRRCVFGMVIDPGQLLSHRRRRQRYLGVPGPSPYVDPAGIAKDLGVARLLFRQGGFSVIDMTDKSIEDSANEVIGLIKRRIPTRNNSARKESRP